MGNKAFLKLVIGTLVVGVGLGVAVIGVVALGDGNGEETAQNNLPQATASGAGTPGPNRPWFGRGAYRGTYQ